MTEGQDFWNYGSFWLFALLMAVGFGVLCYGFAQIGKDIGNDLRKWRR